MSHIFYFYFVLSFVVVLWFLAWIARQTVPFMEMEKQQEAAGFGAAGKRTG